MNRGLDCAVHRILHPGDKINPCTYTEGTTTWVYVADIFGTMNAMPRYSTDWNAAIDAATLACEMGLGGAHTSILRRSASYTMFWFLTGEKGVVTGEDTDTPACICEAIVKLGETKK